MKAIFLFISLLAYCITFSQDVVIFVQAKHEASPIELDTIFVENLSNGTFAKLYDLPNGVTNYEINLSQGAQVNDIGQINETSSNFTLLSNKPGVCSFQIISKPQSNVTFDLYNIHGQKLYHEIKNLSAEISTFEFCNSHSNIGVLKITTVDNCYSIKVFGNANYQTILGNTDCNVLNTTPTVKDVKTNFEFNEGDTLRITVIKQAYHSNSIFIQPINTENYIIYISQPCAGIATVTDYDGNVYNTVKIGNQCWMKENLKATHYSDGTEIQQADIYTDWDWPDVKYYFNCNDNIESSETSGKLYTSGATLRGIFYNDENLQPTNLRGPCPIGWKIPNNDEWQTLIDYTNSGSNSNILKTTYGWYENSNGIDKYGFSILPSGAAKSLSNGTGYYYESCDAIAKYWTSSIVEYAIVYYWSVSYQNNQVESAQSNTQNGYSIRCLKD